MSALVKTALAALALSALAPDAFADPGTGEATRQVTYRDLDMSTPAGGAHLLRRIEMAARFACAEAYPRSPLLPRQITQCRHATVEAAVRSMAIPVLTLAWSGSYPATEIAAR